MEIVIKNLSKIMEERQLSKMCQLQSIQECTGYLGVTVQEKQV